MISKLLKRFSLFHDMIKGSLDINKYERRVLIVNWKCRVSIWRVLIVATPRLSHDIGHEVDNTWYYDIIFFLWVMFQDN